MRCGNKVLYLIKGFNYNTVVQTSTIQILSHYLVCWSLSFIVSWCTEILMLY